MFWVVHIVLTFFFLAVCIQIAVVKWRYEVISTKIKKSLLKAEIITWDSLEHGKQPTILPDPNFLNRFTTFFFFLFSFTWWEVWITNSWHFKIYIICLCNGAEVSMRPAYRSSKKVKDYDKLEAEVKKNRMMISLKETLLWTSSSVRYNWILMRIWGVLEQIICEYLSIYIPI